MSSETIISILAFTLLTLLWLGFGAALLVKRDLLSQAWQRFRSLPLLGQLLVWLLALPVVLALWIWQTSLPGWLRIILVLALAWVTEYTFFPRPLLA